jgi:2-octaprenyl-6-methoxyphenol hydroxylase
VQHFDLAIIGGGLVGASFARAVSRSGLSAVLIDKAPATSLYDKSLDNRGLALSYTTQQILDELSCWERLSKQAYPIEKVHVSEQNSFGFTILDAKKYNLAALGYVVSASDLGAELLTGIELLPNVTVFRPAHLENIVFDKLTQNWSLFVAQQHICAKLIVAADGSNSMLHQLQNIAIKKIDMQQSAVVTNLEITIPNLTTAYERFTGHGVLALLPFGTNRAKCVFTGPDSFVRELTNCSEIDFASIIQGFIGYRLGKFKAVSQRNMFPTSHSYADKIYGDSMVLLGNAANTLHPVAAQGFNLGLRDAVTLAKVLQQAILEDKNINQTAVLAQYAELRCADHAKTRDFTFRLVDVFADPRLHMRLYRRFGILASQLVPALNQKIVKQGLGLCK